MIYPTLQECMRDCEGIGKLCVKGLTEEEYILKRLGFAPRLTKANTG